jgi:hypothetical protein
MTDRIATCRCGQLQATCTGDPVRVSVCHCLSCQKRSGSAFAVQARWPNAQVALTGTYKIWSTLSESGSHAAFRFCPDCGSTVAYVSNALPDLTAIAVGAFADPSFPPPHYSIYEERKHGWVVVSGDGIEHID